MEPARVQTWQRPRRGRAESGNLLVRKEGLEPSRFYPQVPETCASTSSATFAGTARLAARPRGIKVRSPRRSPSRTTPSAHTSGGGRRADRSDLAALRDGLAFGTPALPVANRTVHQDRIVEAAVARRQDAADDERHRDRAVVGDHVHRADLFARKSVAPARPTPRKIGGVVLVILVTRFPAKISVRLMVASRFVALSRFGIRSGALVPLRTTPGPPRRAGTYDERRSGRSGCTHSTNVALDSS